VNKRVDRMPKPSTIASWATQLSGVALAHVFDQMTTDPNAVKVFAHDGTTKNGKKYGTGRYVATHDAGWKSGCVCHVRERVNHLHDACVAYDAVCTSIELPRQRTVNRSVSHWRCMSANSRTAQPRAVRSCSVIFLPMLIRWATP